MHWPREFKTVENYGRPGPHWPAFDKKLRWLRSDAIRLKKREEVSAEEYASKRERLTSRLNELIATDWDDKDVPLDHNHAERAIRPAVMIRKNSFGNRSDGGADTQAVLMSVYRPRSSRGHAPLKTVVDALSTDLATGKLHHFPPRSLQSAEVFREFLDIRGNWIIR